MNIIADNLIEVITLISCITSLIVTFYKIDRMVNKFWNDFHRFHLYTLKIAVLSEELPLIDRIHAGEEYLKLGGNGLVKMKYEELLQISFEELSNKK